MVFVLGHHGMLGSVVHHYLAKQGYRVITSERRYRVEPECALLQDVVAAHAEAVVNCLGAIPAAGRSGAEVMTSNGLLPSHLAAVLGGTLLIHASTDCVFDGSKGHYSIHDAPNSTDAYGLSKRIGEACAFWPNTVILRTSIVGPSAGAGRGLLGWFLSQDGPVGRITSGTGSRRLPGPSWRRGRLKVRVSARGFITPRRLVRSTRKSFCGCLPTCLIIGSRSGQLLLAGQWTELSFRPWR